MGQVTSKFIRTQEMLTAFLRNMGVGTILAVFITKSIVINAGLRVRAPEGAVSAPPTRAGALIVITLIVRFEALCMAVGVTYPLC